MSYKPYFNYLKKESLSGIKGFIVAIFVINLLNGISTGYSLGEGEQFIFLSQSSIMGMGFSAIFAFMCSYTYFNGAMSIRSDRKSYIKASIKWILLLSLLFGIFGIILDLVSIEILKLIFGVNVSMKTQIPWLFGGELQSVLKTVSILDIANIMFLNISNLIVFGALGLFCGALVYRLKVKYSVALFGGVPLLILMYYYNMSINNPEKVKAILMNLLDLSQYVIANPHVAFIMNTLVTIISTFLFIKLLIKAPVKEYAFDLVSFKRK